MVRHCTWRQLPFCEGLSLVLSNVLRAQALLARFAKMLGDTIETVEKHYKPFVRELRERLRRILVIFAALEELGVMTPETTQADLKKPN
jgi:hypothetical protein